MTIRRRQPEAWPPDPEIDLDALETVAECARRGAALEDAIRAHRAQRSARSDSEHPMTREWEFVPPSPPRHHCDLPDPKHYAVGTVIECRHGLKRPEPPKAHRAKGYPGRPPIPCGIRWRVGRAWFWRDHIWRQTSAGYGSRWY